MPKSKKPNNVAEESKTIWRTPVKLPSIAAVEPMKSLYAPDSGATQIELPIKDAAAKPELQNLAAEDMGQKKSNQFSESANTTLSDSTDDTQNLSSAVSAKQSGNAVLMLSDKPSEVENEPVKLDEAEFLKILRTEKMDFYSLAEILRGSSLALYCILFSESLANGENRCQIRQSELMMRARINNPATLYKQERWLTALHLVSKTVRCGNHNGASYEVRPLETLPLPSHILEQLDGYLIELV